MSSMRHRLRGARVWVVRFLRHEARIRAAAEARRGNVVVGPTFTFHVVNRPKDVTPRGADAERPL
jgi:hypothetical protein